MSYLDSVVSYDMAKHDGPDHIYYDISIVNNSETSAPVPIQFTEMRNSAFLNDPDKYFASIIRFHVDTAPSSLPVFIPAIQTGQSDVNLTQYSYTLKYKTYEYQKYIEFVSQNTAESIPAAPTIKQDISNEYYYVHSFAYWVGLCNASLVECFDGLKALVLAGSDTMPTLYAPWIQYDPSSSSLIFNCDKSAYDESLTNPIEIYLNAPMANLFNSFQMICKGFSGIVNGKNYQLVVKNDFGTNVIELDNYDAIQLYEEYPSCGSWSPVASVVFTSSTLPVETTISGAPKTFGGLSNMANYSTNNVMPIITDFRVALVTGKEYLPSIDYVATLYRLIDLSGHQAQNTMQISVYWSDVYNNLHPLNLCSGGSASIKMMFRKKSLGL
jgi:hypothetical protein